MDVGIDVLSGGEEFAGLFIDRLEIVGDLKDFYDSINASRDGGYRVHGL